VFVAASTQPGEEELVLDAAADWWADAAAPLLVIAPRRPERFDSVARLVEERGLRYQRLSAMHDLGQTTQVLVLDTLGDLVRFLPAARAVFVGGTIAPIGGHNVLEPAACAKPVAFGPHTENVAAAAAALLARGGAERVHSAADLARFWSGCLADRPGAERMGEKAREVACASPDVLERTWEIIAPFLGDDS
jgi:3-deoxy-D-manno-octulosonic-acid transferase